MNDHLTDLLSASAGSWRGGSHPAEGTSMATDGIDRRRFIRRLGAMSAAAAVAATFAHDIASDAAIAPIATIQIPRLALSKNVYAGTSKAVLDLGGFGHWLGTAVPGRNGNCMLFSHRTSAGAPVRNIHLMVVGDTITMAGATYRVTAKLIIPVTSIATAINWDPGRRPGLQLLSCARADGLPTSLTHRIVIRAVK